MKSLIACVVAVFALGGCIAVPYAPYDSGPGYGYYGPPAPAFSFNYSYRDGGYYHRRRHW